MTRRYFLPDFPPNGVPISLPPPESMHAIKVMRVQVGESFQVFDGRGRQADATVVNVSRNDCQIRLDSPEWVDREPKRKVSLAIAMPKPDRCRELIERLSELGVTRVTPIHAERTQRSPSANLIEKLRRAVIESCKQSNRNVLMEITDPLTLNSYLHDYSNNSDLSLPIQWIAHPDGQPVQSLSIPSSDPVSILIGPEGGWTDQEIANSISAGFQKVGLGKRIYRIETAATYLAARLIDD